MQFKSAFEIGRFVTLKPPSVMIVGVHFRQNGPGEAPIAHYDILVDNQITENIPEKDIAGYDDVAEERWQQQIAAQRAVQAANVGGAARATEFPGEPVAVTEAGEVIEDTVTEEPQNSASVAERMAEADREIGVSIDPTR